MSHELESRKRKGVTDKLEKANQTLGADGHETLTLSEGVGTQGSTKDPPTNRPGCSWISSTGDWQEGERAVTRPHTLHTVARSRHHEDGCANCLRI